MVAFLLRQTELVPGHWCSSGCHGAARATPLLAATVAHEAHVPGPASRQGPAWSPTVERCQALSNLYSSLFSAWNPLFVPFPLSTSYMSFRTWRSPHPCHYTQA